MGNQIVLTVLFLFAILFLLIFNEMVYRRLGLKGEITRKFAHFTSTLSTVTFPYLFESHWYVLFLASLFFILLFVSRNRTYLKSIHDIDRESLGSFLLPVAIYLTFLVADLENNRFLFILPILILAISDPIAGILGINLQQYNHKIKLFGWNPQKTWLGSLSFFVSSLIISIIAFYFNQGTFTFKAFWLSLVVATVSTLTEMVSWRGTDNLVIPMSVLIVLLIFL
jgi:dolichol kinase